MRMKRTFVLGAKVATIAVWAAPTSAAPKAGCPPTFRLMTFDQILAEWPPPPGVDGEAQLAAIDRNSDKSLCVMLLPEPVPGPGVDVIDNVVAK
jgi:hypothetical protein